MSAMRRIKPLNQFATIGTQSDLLGLAWLCEQAACWQNYVGNGDRAEVLYQDASTLRSDAKRKASRMDLREYLA